jgi:hypothetical protein
MNAIANGGRKIQRTLGMIKACVAADHYGATDIFAPYNTGGILCLEQVPKAFFAPLLINTVKVICGF